MLLAFAMLLTTAQFQSRSFLCRGLCEWGTFTANIPCFVGISGGAFALPTPPVKKEKATAPDKMPEVSRTLKTESIFL